MLDESDRINNAESLVSLCLDYVVDNLALYTTENRELLQALPSLLKNRILKRFTTSSYFWRDVEFKSVLSAILNESTSHINLTLAQVDDEMLRILRNGRNLRRIYLCTKNDNLMTTTGFQNLLRCLKQLDILLVPYTDEIDDTILECLAHNCPNLMGLDIRACKNVTDIGVKSLSTLKNLTWLTFAETQITDDGIISLVRGPSGGKIKELRIDNCAGITEISLEAIARNCPNIEILMFYNSPTDSVVTTFQTDQLKRLKQITWTFSW